MLHLNNLNCVISRLNLNSSRIWLLTLFHIKVHFLLFKLWILNFDSPQKTHNTAVFLSCNFNIGVICHSYTVCIGDISQRKWLNSYEWPPGLSLVPFPQFRSRFLRLTRAPHTPRRHCAYWSLLHPWHLDFASEVWAVAGGSIPNAEKLEQVKLSATVMISGL